MTVTTPRTLEHHVCITLMVKTIPVPCFSNLLFSCAYDLSKYYHFNNIFMNIHYNVSVFRLKFFTSKFKV